MANPPSISGLYEICIGVTEQTLLQQLAYWQLFGYRIGPVGGI